LTTVPWSRRLWRPSDAINQHTVVFKADKTGVFDFVCYVVCGYGHSFMVLKGALQVYE